MIERPDADGSQGSRAKASARVHSRSVLPSRFVCTFGCEDCGYSRAGGAARRREADVKPGWDMGAAEVGSMQIAGQLSQT